MKVHVVVILRGGLPAKVEVFTEASAASAYLKNESNSYAKEVETRASKPDDEVLADLDAWTVFPDDEELFVLEKTVREAKP
jgi:hypothetical protein